MHSQFDLSLAMKGGILGVAIVGSSPYSSVITPLHVLNFAAKTVMQINFDLDANPDTSW